MANQRHIEILKQGGAYWNSWKDANPTILADLRYACLAEMSLCGFNLTGVDLSGAQLQYSDLTGSILNGTNLFRADLRGARLHRTQASEASFTEANLECTRMGVIECWGSFFSKTNLERAMLDNLNLSFCKFRQARLRNASLQNADLTGCDFSCADLSQADLSGAILREANFTGAWIWRTDLSGCNLEDVLCENVHMGPDRNAQVNFTQGEFEKLFSRTRIQFCFPSGNYSLDGLHLRDIIRSLDLSNSAYFAIGQNTSESHETCVAITFRPQSCDDLNKLSDFEKEAEKLKDELIEKETQLKHKQDYLDIAQTEKNSLEQDYNRLLKQLAREKLENSPISGTLDKFMVVCFFDLKGSTGHDANEEKETISTFWRLGDAEIPNQGGQYLNTWGDAIVACFDDVNVAIRASINFIAYLNQNKLPCRAGINIGRIWVRHNPITKRNDIGGSEVHLAERIQSATPPGTVCISGNVRYCDKLDRTLFRIEPITVTLKKATREHPAGSDLQVFSITLL